jgi:hypothetical protein
MGENHIMLSYISNITFIGSTNFQNSLAPTEKRHQPPVYRIQPEGSYNSLYFPSQTQGGSNPLIYRLQPKGSYKSMYSPTPTRRRLQPPFLAPSFLTEI